MRQSTFTAFLCLSLLWLFSPSADAYGVMDWTNRADIICIASYDSHKQTGGTVGSEGQRLGIYAATMNVKEVWKGSLPGQKIVLQLTRHEHDGLQLLYRPFSHSHYYLIFGRRLSGSVTRSSLYVPLDPDSSGDLYNAYESAIPIRSIAPTVSPQQPLFFKITRQILAGLWTSQAGLPEDEARVSAFDFLKEFDWLYIDEAKPSPDLPPGINAGELKALISDLAIPKLLELTKDADAETRFDALDAAARLQQTQVIPNLARGAESNSNNANSMATGLAYFQNKAAEPLLVVQLKNTNPMARLFTIEALEYFQDRRLIPYFIDVSNDPDGGVQDRALYALYEITKLPTDYTLWCTPFYVPLAR